MTRQELEVFNNGLEAVGELRGTPEQEGKFVYAVSRTLLYCEPEIKCHQKVMKPSSEFIEYQNKFNNLLEEHCSKDKDGNPKKKIIGPGIMLYEGVEGNKKFEEAKVKLEKKYQKALDEREKQKKIYEKLMEEEVEVKIHKVKYKFVPTDISSGQLKPIMVMIED